MKRILYVVNADWYFYLHWIDRALYLKEKGYDVSLASPITNDEIVRKIESLGIDFYELKFERSSLSPFEIIKVLGGLRKVIKEVKPHLVHSITIKPNFYLSIINLFKRFSLVSTYPGLGTLTSTNKKRYRIGAWGIFTALKYIYSLNSAHLVFENDEDLRYFKEKNIAHSSHLHRVQGAGVDMTKYNYFPKITESSSESFKIFFASRLLKSKGLHLLVDAVGKLHSQGYDVELSVAGIEDQSSPLAYSKKDIYDFSNEIPVKWLGKRNDINELIRQCDIVALPSTYGEGIPRILIEACAVGRGIITTSLGGCKEICIDKYNGLTVLPNDQTSIELAIEYLVKNPSKVQEFGENGRKLVEHNFSNESIFKSHDDIYTTALEGS